MAHQIDCKKGCKLAADIAEKGVAQATHNYDIEYIYQGLNNPLCLEIADDLLDYIEVQYEDDVDSRHPGVTQFDAQSRSFKPIFDDTQEKLTMLHARLAQSRERQRKKCVLHQRLFAKPDSTLSHSESETAVMQNSTDAPQYSEDGCSTPSVDVVEYHMAGLPPEQKNLFTFDDDIIYTKFRNCLQEVGNDWIANHRKQDWNVVRFVCILRGIFAKKQATMKLFSAFLCHIGFGEQESNMKHRKDANDSDNFTYYDDPKKCKWSSCKKLKEDGSEMEDYFAPVIECLKSAN